MIVISREQYDALVKTFGIEGE
jgi:hypothetical protein